MIQQIELPTKRYKKICWTDIVQVDGDRHTDIDREGDRNRDKQKRADRYLGKV